MVGGLVEDDQLRLEYEHIGQGDTLLLSAAELSHWLLEVANLQLGEYLLGFQHPLGVALMIEAGVEHALVRIETG